jgi:hypothetical protein
MNQCDVAHSCGTSEPVCGISTCRPHVRQAQQLPEAAAMPRAQPVRQYLCLLSVIMCPCYVAEGCLKSKATCLHENFRHAAHTLC